MKKLIYALPLLVLGGCQAVTDGVKQFENGVMAPPTLVVDAAKAVLNFLINLFGASLETVLHKFLPF